jgi:hypothetical protein
MPYLFPDTPLLPSEQATTAGASRPAPQFFGQCFPGDGETKDDQDADERSPVINPRSPAPVGFPEPGKVGLDEIPKIVRQQI